MLKLATLGLMAGSGVACVKTARSGGSIAGSSVLAVFDGPPNLPPTPAPTPPPPPPPFAVGWVPAPPRQNAVQMKTRQNCDKSVEFIAPETGTGAIDRDLLQEQFIYTCKYQMYIEVDLFGTQGPTGCACGLSWGRQVPPQDPSYEATYLTHIDKFSLQVYDTQLQVPLEEIPGFDNLRPNIAATDTINQQLNSALQSSLTEMNSDMKLEDFATARNVFTGIVNSSTGGAGFDPQALPLLRDDPANQNNVPVMCFEVTDVYRTAYRWPEPPVPVLSSPPNAYVTNCVPFVPKEFEGAQPILARKRWHNFEDPAYAGVSYWVRDFLLFAVQSAAGVSVGWAPQSRYLTAYYSSSDCSMLGGVVTFDRQFTTTSLARNTELFGGFNWHRKFDANGYSVIGGVPQSIIQNRYARVGFHTIAWRENFARDLRAGMAKAFRPKILFHFLNGTYITADGGSQTAEQLFDGLPLGWEYTPGGSMEQAVTVVPHRYKLCEQVPLEWRDAAAPCSKADVDGGSNCPYTDDRYQESAFYWHVRSTGAAGSVLSCAQQGAFQTCAANNHEDVTFLSFQNDGTGSLARDFSKKTNSILLTGPRSKFCSDATLSAVPSFDPMSYKAIKASEPLRKRAVAEDQFLSAEDVARVPAHLQFKRQTVEYDIKPAEPLYGAPQTESIIANAAGGSYDVENDVAAGSHPIALFDETYTVPLSLDPDDADYNGHTDGYLFDDTFSACLQGTQGCNCRDRTSRRSCDAPLDCNDENYCVAPACQAGDAGCDCKADNTCSSDLLSCNTQTSTCVFEETCPPGATGCVCKPSSEVSRCADATSACVAEICQALDCPPGLPGCACNDDLNVGPECFVQQSSCTNNVCVGGTVAGQSVTALKMLGGDCSTNDDCSASEGAVCDASGVCTAPRCAAGATGCRCDAGACASAGDECDAATNLCLTSSCEHGAKGCMCLFGYSCEAGFECLDTATETRRLERLPSNFVGARVDRCVTARCLAGDNGCPCTDSCNGRGFECKVMDKTTGAKRCVATGRECGLQSARCVAYCGAENVVRCPGCSDQIPQCKLPSSAGMLAAPAALLLLLAAFLVEAF